MTTAVLAYHSHNIRGNEYGTNDHVALAADLERLCEIGARIVPLKRVAEVVGMGQVREGGGLEVAITFDDGPVFDFSDFVHPDFGPQRAFINIFRDFNTRHPGAQPQLGATAFVIASPAARAAMERHESCGYPFLSDWLSDAWWPLAADTGMLEIGNHSWDHVHQAVPEICTTRGIPNDFASVECYVDADREIRQAAAYIDSRSGGRCTMFAFPFGHTNDYLLNEYFPERVVEHGMTAAFGAGGRPVRSTDGIWNIPRAICGHHWKTPQELAELLRS
jgi:peptidoglycan/xylan/chitin deacetylase (PgdA/CDA1 family)